MPPQKQRGRLGRVLVIAVYAIVLSYLVVVGFASVIPQVFWPEKDESFDVGCDEGLRLLYRELEQMRLGYLSTNVDDPTALRSELKPWDLRLNALHDRCDETKVDLLNKYRYRVELSLQRYMRDDAPLASTAAEAFGGSPAPPQASDRPTEQTP